VHGPLSFGPTPPWFVGPFPGITQFISVSSFSAPPKQGRRNHKGGTDGRAPMCSDFPPRADSARLRPAGRDTVLVVLGDARTNRIDPLPWALEEIARRCRYVLWLVPEARERWGTGDSELACYLPFVDTVVEARDLNGIARGLQELLRRW